MSQPYKGTIYSNRREMTLTSARRVLEIVGRLVEVGSAVDLGCGTGTWLSVAKAQGHVNEQWQSFWAEKFAARGYVAVDAIRPEIWDDPSIPF